MSGVLTTTRCHRRIVESTFRDEHLRVLTTLNSLKRIAHSFARLFVDDFWAGHILTILCVVRDGVIHVRDTAFVHQVYNQLELVQTLKVRHFWRIARFSQRFKTCFYQLDSTTTKNSLLTE